MENFIVIISDDMYKDLRCSYPAVSHKYLLKKILSVDVLFINYIID